MSMTLNNKSRIDSALLYNSFRTIALLGAQHFNMSMCDNAILGNTDLFFKIPIATMLGAQMHNLLHTYSGKIVGGFHRTRATNPIVRVREES